MITPQTLDQYDQMMSDSIKASFAHLHTARVFRLQIIANELDLLKGDADEPPDQLARRILKLRTINQHLLMLDQLGETYVKELNHES